MASSGWSSIGGQVAMSPQSVLSSSSVPSSSGSDGQSMLMMDKRDRTARQIGQEEDSDADNEGEEDGGNVSAITDPSWYGSPFAHRNSSVAWATSPSDGEARSPLGRRLSSYQKGLHLARRALLEMDEEVDKMRLQQDEGSWQADVEQSKSQGKRRAVAAADTASTKLSCGTEILTSFEECPTYLCASCGTTLALQDELISKAFSGRDGKAYLFFSILNIRPGPKEDRQLLTGLHTVADLSCATCERSVGWSYLRAFESSQRYKEGE